MRQKLLIGTMLCGSLLMMSGIGVAYGQTCTASPSCTELGYTKTQSECGEDGIKCPFGNLWSCKPKPARASCAVGWIYYNDETCSAEVISGKTALGVVVYVNPNGIGGQVMSAWPVDENGNKCSTCGGMAWATSITDILSLPNYLPNINNIELYMAAAAQDFYSCSNTDRIVKEGDSNMYPAAWAARSYAPTTETKGRWCLPAAGVINSIHRNRTAVQAGISKLGGVTYQSCWSSSEANYSDALCSVDYYSLGINNRHKSKASYVRPVLEF